MPAPLPLLRPRDSDALRAALRGLARASAAPILFGGEVHDGEMLQLSDFFGTWTRGLHGLMIPSAAGLGGRAVAQRRPAKANDYPNEVGITHDFDGPVRGEGIRSVLAVPVVVDGTARAVLYGATRGTGALGDRTADELVRSAHRLSIEFAIRDEIDRRDQMRDVVLTGSDQPAMLEEIRDIHAELRSLTAAVADARVQRQLRALAERLAQLTTNEREPVASVVLTPRETDVLSQIALGCTNAEAAKRLSIGPETVKAYLRTAMAKLGATNRHEAVVSARRAGLLP
jgi:LuxR family transcriptional regulator, regulator of acetate metabolism